MALCRKRKVRSRDKWESSMFVVRGILQCVLQAIRAFIFMPNIIWRTAFWPVACNFGLSASLPLMTLIKSTTRAEAQPNRISRRCMMRVEEAPLRSAAYKPQLWHLLRHQHMGAFWLVQLASGGFYDCHRQLQLTLLDPGPANN